MSDDRLLEGLDDEQREAVTTRASPLVILAGAGSGKTRVLTRRIAWQSRQAHIEPEHVLAVTFTRKAAGELSTRLVKLGVRRDVAAGTFHAIALSQLSRRCTDRDQSMPRLVERKARLIVPMLPGRGRERGLLAAEIATEIEWAKARLLQPDQYAAAALQARRTPPRPPAEVATWYERYERERRRRRLLDFEDLLWWYADALENDTEFQATQRWRFRHVFVDEFQDANPAQFRLVRAWLGDRSDLCVVGDGDQAIYGFAGADASYLTTFEHHFPGATVVQLATNYRSTPQIVRVAESVLGSSRPPNRAPRPDGPVPTVTTFPTDEAEATGVARAVQRARLPGARWSSLAVLYRTNAQSAVFEEAFARASIPFTVRGSARFLDRPEVKVALDELRDRARQRDARPFADHLAELTEHDGAATEERREHTAALARLGREYLEADGGPGSYEGFLGFLEAALQGRDGDAAAPSDAVELLSFHRAKGLEFDTVFVCGLEQGLVPIVHAETAAELDEERRLLHVALSRAGRALNVSWARRRAIGMRTYQRTPSPWLDAIESARRELAGDVVEPGEDGGGRAALAEARERVARARRPTRVGEPPVHVAPDPELYAALVEWRRNLARASGVPAFVIFHDTTLEALAARQPRSESELQSIPGIGPVKAARHGDAVLELVRNHAG